MKQWLRVSVAVITAVCGLAANAAAKDIFVANTPGGPDHCPHPNFATIQQAVDAAAPGDHVKVCPGTYAERVVIDTTAKNNISLESIKSLQAHIQFPPLPPAATSPNAVVLVRAAQNVTIKGFTIEGPWSDTTGCVAGLLSHVGIRVDGGGGASITENHITQIQDANPALRGCQDGVAIRVGRFFETPSQTGTADIVNNTIDNYQKNGPTIDGPGSKGRIENNTIDGGGPNAIIAKNGIQLGRGASGQVTKNRVSGNSYAGAGPPPAGDTDDSSDATGILVFEVAGGVAIISNTLSNNDIGFSLGIGLGNQEDPALPAMSSSVQVLTNISSGNRFDALRAHSDAQTNLFQANQSKTSGVHDCHDDSTDSKTAGTANTWKDNRGTTQTPTGICKP